VADLAHGQHVTVPGRGVAWVAAEAVRAKLAATLNILGDQLTAGGGMSLVSR